MNDYEKGFYMGVPNYIAINKKYIFVDFFDTVMFRYIHSDEVRPQWAKRMNKFYPSVNAEKWISVRNEIIGDNDECSINYEYLIKKLYERLSCNYFLDDEESFKKKVFDADKYIDMAVQYPNKCIVSWLQKQRSFGKKVFIVSDYYLPARAIKSFLKFHDLNELFDGVFSSSDFEKTKRNGELYEYVIEELKVDKNSIVMIGDNVSSDFLMAREHGIDSYRYFPVFHKCYTNIHKCVGKVNIDRYVFNKCYKYSQFAEYGMDLFVFCEQFKNALTQESNQSKTICFMSRGGYLLKRAFEEYMYWSSNTELLRYKTTYLRFSRKVSCRDNIEGDSRNLLIDYLTPYVDNNELLFVDEGWYGHGQDSLEMICPWKIKGYYLGLIENTNGSDKRKGLIFGENPDKSKSPYYGVFRTNCTFYEQILTAPHGSLISVEKNTAGEYVFNEEWADQEKSLYENYTKGLQEKLIECMSFLLAWNSELNLYDFAKYKLKSLLFANKSKIQILNIYDKNFYNNFTASQERWFGKRSSIKVNIRELLTFPENYMRYFCKIKEKRNSSVAWEIIYLVFTPLIYLYCRLSLAIKHF